MDILGDSDSKKMPEHFFYGALYIDHKTATRGNPEKQNFSVCPRHWYVDADFKCGKCRREFTWTAGEQKSWFETYYFWVDSKPRHCKTCSAQLRDLEELRKEYDANVGSARMRGSSDEKRRIVEIVGKLEEAFGVVPQRMLETRDLFARQIAGKQA